MPKHVGIAARVLQEVEASFGYPIGDAAVRDELLSDWKTEAEDDSPFEEIFGFFVATSVAWAAEGLPGARPEAAANAASAVRLGDEPDDDDDELEPEPPELVARHFCGLLTLQVTVFPRPSRHWLADLNVPLATKAAAPIYAWSGGADPEGAVYASQGERETVRKLLRDLARAEATEDDAALAKHAALLRDRHPRAFALEHAALVKKGLLPAPMLKPVPDAGFTDAAGALMWSTFRAFVPVGRVLVARSLGERGARLSAAEARALAAIAGRADLDAWPPALLAGLLGPALAGDAASARKLAQAILKQKRGVALTQRWAELVLGGEGPLAG